MNNIITKQRNLMQQAMEYYNEIKIIERHFNKEEAIIQLKIELLEERYAETVTKLARLIMSTCNKDIELRIKDHGSDRSIQWTSIHNKPS